MYTIGNLKSADQFLTTYLGGIHMSIKLLVMPTLFGKLNYLAAK